MSYWWVIGIQLLEKTGSDNTGMYELGTRIRQVQRQIDLCNQEKYIVTSMWYEVYVECWRNFWGWQSQEK